MFNLQARYDYLRSKHPGFCAVSGSSTGGSNTCHRYSGKEHPGRDPEGTVDHHGAAESCPNCKLLAIWDQQWAALQEYTLRRVSTDESDDMLAKAASKPWGFLGGPGGFGGGGFGGPGDFGGGPGGFPGPNGGFGRPGAGGDGARGGGEKR